MTNIYDTTKEPLGSTSIKVLTNNISNLDEAVNAFIAYWIDRFGDTRKTLRGFEMDFASFLLASGYEFIGDYDTDGPLTITRPNQVFSHDGEYFRTGPELALPYTTAGNWATDGSKFALVGDAVLRQDLANALDPTKGSAMINTRFESGPVRTQKAKNYDMKFVSDFDNIQAGVQWFVDNNVFGVLYADKDFTISSTVLIPRGVQIDLQKYKVRAALPGLSMFQSAYVADGVIISNIGTAPQSHTLYHGGIRNGTIADGDIGLHLQDCIDQCDFSDLYFENCTADCRGSQIFYPHFSQWMSRTTAGNAPFPMLDVSGNINAMSFSRMSSVGREIGYKVSNAAAVAMYSSNAESGLVGVQSGGQLSAFTSIGGYFEALTSAGIDFTNSTGKYSTNLTGNYFNGCAIGIAGVQMFGGRISGNYFVNCPQWVSIPDNVSTIRVEVEDEIYADVGSTLIPTKYTLGRLVVPEGRAIIYDSGTGLPMAASEFSGGILTGKFGGNVGKVPIGRVPFCNPSTSPLGPSGVSVYLTSQIVFQDEADVIFKLRVIDNTEDVIYTGILMGDTWISKNWPAGHTVNITHPDGYYVFELTGHHIPATYSVTGKIKLIA